MNQTIDKKVFVTEFRKCLAEEMNVPQFLAYMQEKGHLTSDYTEKQMLGRLNNLYSSGDKFLREQSVKNGTPLTRVPRMETGRTRGRTKADDSELLSMLEQMSVPVE